MELHWQLLMQCNLVDYSAEVFFTLLGFSVQYERHDDTYLTSQLLS